MESDDTTWRFDGQSVLVVDDGDENRELLVLVLGEVGLNVDTAENGEVGVQMAREKDYSIILMDMQMPVMDGYTATKVLRQGGATTPIYALTANAMKGFERDCLAVGCTGYLTKPIEIDVLLSALGKELDGREIDKPDTEPLVAEPPKVEILPSLTTTVPGDKPLESSLPMDRPEFRRLVEMFVPRLQGRLEEMSQHLENHEFAQLAKLAHWLKGTGGTVGFDVFTEPAVALEDAAKAYDAVQANSALVELTQMANRIVVPELV